MKLSLKLPKQVSLRIATALILCSIILAAGFSILYMVLASAPSSTFWFAPGIYPGAPSFTVWKEGNNYLAKDINGHLEFSGDDASTVIQSCIDELPTYASGYGRGQRILVMNPMDCVQNWYRIYYQINVTCPVTIEGVNEFGSPDASSTQLLTTMGDGEAIFYVTSQDVCIKNFVFSNANGKTENCSGVRANLDNKQIKVSGNHFVGLKYGLYVEYVLNAVFEHNKFYDNDVAFYLGGQVGNYSNSNSIRENIIANNNNVGLYLEMGNGNTIIANDIEGNDIGIKQRGYSRGNVFFNNWLELNGIDLDFNEPGDGGLYVQDARIWHSEAWDINATFGVGVSRCRFESEGNEEDVFDTLTINGEIEIHCGDSHSGTDLPTYSYEGQLFYQTDTDTLHVYNGTDWLTVYP